MCLGNLRKKMISWLMRDRRRKDFMMSDYERMCYELRVCDVLLVEGSSRVSEVIKLITQSSWSHAMLYIGRFNDIENPELRAKILADYPNIGNEELVIESLLGKGTIISPLKNYEREHIRICRPRGITHSDAKQVVFFAMSKLGLKYDIRNIFGLAHLLFPWSIIPARWRARLFRRHATRPIRIICSTLIAQAFDSVEFPILPVIRIDHDRRVELIKRNPRLFTPSDFDYSPFFDIIKYPMMDSLFKNALYRDLPWNRQGAFSNDDGRIYISQHYTVITDPNKLPPDYHSPDRKY